MAQLGFMLTRSLYASSGSRSFHLLAKAALDKGHTVRVFFCADGVYQCLKQQQPVALGDVDTLHLLDELSYDGAELIVSHACMVMRGIKAADLQPTVRVGTFEELNRIVGLSEQVVCL